MDNLPEIKNLVSCILYLVLRTSRDYFRPLPQSFRKEKDNIYIHFRTAFVEFVVILTKIWPTNMYL